MNMNNNKEMVSELDKMVRARSVYITSDLIPFDSDASSGIYQLKEPVYAQDGYDLVYGVRAFGFNASATNISHKQRNNKLTFRVEYLTPLFVYNSSTADFQQSTQSTIQTNYDVSFPEGLYTTDQLFQMLSSEQNYAMYSGYQVDVLNVGPYYVDYTAASTEVNKLFIKSTFTRTSGGFSVRPEISSQTIINSYLTVENTKQYSAYQVNNQLKQFSIIRNSDSPELYDLLFTNEFTDTKDHAGEVPQFETIIKGKNPPNQIDFLISIPLYSPSVITNTTILPAVVSPQTSMTFTVQYPGDDSILDRLDFKYPANGFLAPTRGARFYHLPNINPLYIDVQSDLPTLSVTANGGLKGLLLRQFALGGDNGSTSFFQQYDNPIYYRTSSSKESIDSIRLTFQAENNKWNFFNLEFFIELVVFEYKQESIQSNPFSEMAMNYNNSSVQGKNYHMPTEDEITSSMGSTHNSFPFRHLGNDQSVVYFQDPLEAKLKRLRK